MARVNLTPARVDAFRCEAQKSQSFLWDSKCHCLAVRATRGGAKAYICQAKLHGKDVRITLGSPNDWTIQDAREAATRFKVNMDQGLDPRTLAAAAKSAANAASAEREAKQVGARVVWDAYLKAPHPKWGPTHRRDHEIAAQPGGQKPKRGKNPLKPGPLASLLAMPLNRITADVVSAWLKKESISRPTAAGNSLRKFRAFINWCAEHPTYQRAAHPDCATAKIVTDYAPPKNTKEQDALQREQLAGWFEGVRGLSNPVISAYLQGLLLTGARRTEWQLLRWDDVDFKGQKLTIRDKVEGQRVVPLTPFLAALLGTLPRVNGFVFSSETAKDGYVIGVSKPHAQACVSAGLAHVSLHGLRRSFATLSEWLEIPVGVVAQIQGHKPSAVAEKHYKRRPIDLLRMYHERLEAWMLEQAGINWGADQTFPTSALVRESVGIGREVPTQRSRRSMAEAFARLETIVPPKVRESSPSNRQAIGETRQRPRPVKMSEVFASVIEGAIHRSPAQLAEAAARAQIAARSS